MEVEPFADNWSYLKAELRWLDRLLSLAIAQQRNQAKAIESIARTRADKVTSHWWQGLVNLEADIAYDSPAEMPRRKSASKATYQQQMEAKISASRQQGICLGLPCLSDRLHLSSFEKNLVLMALAPEINRRYGQFYNYLQNSEESGASRLPTVDLVLRLLCRTDAEWRTGRKCFTTDAVLLRCGLLELPVPMSDTLLMRPIKLTSSLVDFLLAEQPDRTALEQLLNLATSNLAARQDLVVRVPLPKPVDWSQLVLPNSVVVTLQQFCQRVQLAAAVESLWTAPIAPVGDLALLVGGDASITSTAVQMVAQALQGTLVQVDLTHLTATAQQQWLETVSHQCPPVVWVKSAQHWLGRSPSLPSACVTHWLTRRQQQPTITFLSVAALPNVRPSWRSQIPHTLMLPELDVASRQWLWQSAIPAGVAIAPKIDWSALAQLSLTGEQIQQILRQAVLLAIADSSQPTLTLGHLQSAHHFFHPDQLFPMVPTQSKRGRRRSIKPKN